MQNTRTLPPHRSHLLRWLLVGLALMMWRAAPALSSAKPGRVLILPFVMHAQTDLAFLQHGIHKMLATRLADPGKVAVVDPQALQNILGKNALPSDEDAVLALASRVGADYVAMGSLTVFGESISTDARFINVAERRNVVTLSESGQNRGAVIQHIDRFANQVNASIFGRPSEAQAAAQPLPQPSAGADDPYRDPERLWHAQGGGRQDAAGLADSGGPGGRLWKSKKLGAVFKAIAVGDVDGDRCQETALLGDTQVTVLRHNGQSFDKRFDFPLPQGLQTLAIDAADINGNGRDELFVTAVRDDYRPSSLVLEWSPGQERLIPIQTRLEWFLRAVSVPDRKQRVLLGQQGGRQEIFYGPIQELQWIAGAYVATTKAGVPVEANVFGIGFGDLMQNGQYQTVHFTKNDHLRLTLGQAEEWTSGEQYGGSYGFLVPPEDWEQATRLRRGNDPMPENRQYLPQRLIVEDIDGDGKQELIVVGNHDGTDRIFTRVRVFRQGRFNCLAWDNVGLTPKWRTRNFDGYISDYAWTDIDNDGHKELAFVVVVSAGALGLGKDNSYIVIWHGAAALTPAVVGTKAG